MLILFLLVVLIVILLSLPSVQSSLAQKITKGVNDKYGTSIYVDKLGLKWNGDLNLKGVYIKDHHQDTLIYSKSLATSIISFNHLLEDNFDLGHIDFDHAKLYIKRYKGEQSDNISIFSKKFVPENPNPNAPPFLLKSPEVTFKNSVFRYTDEELDLSVPVFYTDLNATLNDFSLKGAIVNTYIDHLSFNAKQGYDIKSLEGNLHYDADLISLNNFSLATENSSLAGSIELDTSDNKLRDFNNLVEIKAAFAKAEISTNDITPFYKGFAKDLLFSLKGNLTGVLNDFTAHNFRLKGLNNSVVEGNLKFENVLTPDHLIIRGNYKEASTSYFDLKKLMPETFEKLPPQLVKLGIVRFNGSNTVTTNSLKTTGNLITNLGNGALDITISNFQNSDEATYNGHVTLNEFDLGSFINDDRVGKTSMDLDVNGKGFIQESLDTKLSGSVLTLDYMDYVYRDITVFGNLNAPKFNGELIIKDPNLKGKINGLIDISKAINSYDLEADISYVDLNAINLVKDSISILSANVLVDMKGTGIEDAFGTIHFSDASYRNKNDTYFFKDFDIKSRFSKTNVRTIDINSSDIIDGSIEGIFKFDEVVPLFKNAIGSLYTNYQPEILTQNQYIYFDFIINNKIVEVFIPEIKLEPKTIIRGNVIADDAEFKLNFKSPRIEAYGNMAQQIEIKVDNQNPLFNTYVAADSIDAGFYAVSDFNLINVTLKDTLFMKSEFQGGKRNEDIYDLSLYHTINKDGNSVLGFKKSEVTFKNTPWLINKDNSTNNRVIFDNNFKDIDIETIALTYLDEQIDVRGAIRDTLFKDIKANFTNVDLKKITPEIDSLILDGRVNGSFELLQKNRGYYPTSNVVIDNFSINEFNLGDFDLQASGNTSLTRYTIDATLENDITDSFKASGYIDTEDAIAQLNIDVFFDNFDLKPFDPLGENVISNLRGTVDGKASLVGDYFAPDINGKLELNNAGLKIPYLNTDYDFKGYSSITLDKSDFIFNAIQLEDVKHQTIGALNGTISHRDFTHWDMDLKINADRLLVLDTKNEVGALYYGTAFINGEATIKGPTDNLVIDVLAETEEGTVFNVPIDDSETLGDISYIHFLSPEEKEARINGEIFESTEIKGLTVNFDLDIDTDALIEVVVDQENGSILKGRGGGILLIELDTNGKFKMYGDYSVFDGSFIFKYSGLVQKEFKVKEGSNIIWDGDPFDAQLDISAVYSAEANPSILLENPSVNRKIPVDVVINLKEQLLQPDITFDIEFPNASSTVISELEYRLSDTYTRELNAISLVSQGVFISETSISSAAAVNNLLETTSSVLSGILFSDDDTIFDVNLDLVQADNTPQSQAAGRVGVTLSTQITNRVLINGKVGVPTGGLSESVIVGDVEVDFLLNEDGSLRAKVFNRQSDIQFIGETEGYTQGAGISYSVDFNSFKELMRKIFSGKSKEAFDQLNQQQNTSDKVGPEGVNFKQ